MSLCDPIADMLTRVRNGATAGLEQVAVPHSVLKSELARLLKQEGYIKNYVVEGTGVKKTIQVVLRYGVNDKPVIQGLKRVSKSGLRRYTGAAEVPRVLGGMGTAILSTSKGLMTGREARKQNVGGEVLCYVW
ncbi:MAG: 30S ribosomal protein S8 [Verrucomicrobia bacterium]|nr:MAG: 30S ribosomal protein S8 [Verrucomicrobiota bacterium]